MHHLTFIIKNKFLIDSIIFRNLCKQKPCDGHKKYSQIEIWLGYTFHTVCQYKSPPQEQQASEIITINSLKKSGNLIIEAIDHSIGMDEETSKKIFEPFFTTKEPGKGTGMGMAISFGIIEKHKGKFKIESEKGAGTTFRIVLRSPENTS